MGKMKGSGRLKRKGNVKTKILAMLSTLLLIACLFTKEGLGEPILEDDFVTDKRPLVHNN